MSAATSASATKHALADAAIDFERWCSPSRATETAAGGRAGKKKGWGGHGERRRGRRREADLKIHPLVSFLRCFGCRAARSLARSRPGLAWRRVVAFKGLETRTACARVSVPSS